MLQNLREYGAEVTCSTWSCYNVKLAEQLPETYVGSPTVCPSPVSEWPTQLTVLKRAQAIKTYVSRDRKTIITLDMALYEKAVQLQLSRKDCKDKWILNGYMGHVPQTKSLMQNT